MEKINIKEIREKLSIINFRINFIIDSLINNNFELYVVGGFTRDYLNNPKKTNKDVDLVTNATPNEIINIFKNQEVKLVGKNFGVVVVDNIEIATFRKDKYNGLSDKNVEIKYSKTVEEDSGRRDFTINQIYFCLNSGRIIDYHNGQYDLKNKIIRFIGDPKDRIFEDPNRIIRACRFLAKIDGDFDDKTFEFLKTYSDYVDTSIRKERIRLEILKAMEIKKASIFFRSLYDIGALKYIFPSLSNSYNLPGGPYHIEPVFDHCVAAGDHITTKFPLIKLAGYMHDIGKSISCRTNPKTDDIWFEGHEETGHDAVKKEFEELRFSNEEITYVSMLVKLHMRIAHERLFPKGIRRTLAQLKEYNIPYQDLLRVSIGDKMGGYKSRVFYTIKDVYSLAKSFRSEVNRKNPAAQFSDLKVNGFDVMTLTGLKPGKEVGEILTRLMDLVLDQPELNERESLISCIRSIMEE